MQRTSVLGYAKINLYLDVISKYENGYHEVNTVMQTVSLYDTVSLEKQYSGITVCCDNSDVPCDEKNLAYCAAALFFDRTGIPCGVIVEIEKKIPISAGLAGGSADAAATLLGLNELYDFPLAENDLIALGASLGADVPFCMTCGTAFADGKGDRLHTLPDIMDCYIVVARAGEGVSTPWAYGELDRLYNNFECYAQNSDLLKNLLEALDAEDLDNVCKNMKNVFEDAVIRYRPMVQSIKGTLIEGGALGAMMSGSGTAVFGIFNDKSKAVHCAERLRSEGAFAVLTAPLKKKL